MRKFGGKRKGEKRYSLFATWLDGVLSASAFPPEVVAFNFNIYTNMPSVCDLELIGAPVFELDNEDWACEELFASGLLRLSLAPEDGSWEESFAAILGLVQRYLQEGPYRQLLLGRKAVGVGHVSGSIALVHLASEDATPSLYGEAAAPPSQAFSAPLAEPGVQNRQGYAPQEPALEQQPEEPPGMEVCYKLIREIRPRAISCAPKREYTIRRYELLRGEPLAQWEEAFTFQYKAEKGDIPTDLLYNTLGWLVVSTPLRTALEKMHTKAEYFPVRVEETKSGQEQPGYWVANLLCKRDALCPEASTYAAVENEVYGSYSLLKKPVLRKDALAGADIFKLQDHQEIPVYVTERFKQEMEQAGFTGLAYFPVALV